jgi:hypothetical protein
MKPASRSLSQSVKVWMRLNDEIVMTPEMNFSKREKEILKWTAEGKTSAEVTNAQRLGFALGMTTQGVSADGSKTTSILLIDGKKYHKDTRVAYVSGAETDYNPINYYVGLRNIDMLMSGYGSIGLENGQHNDT